MPEVIRCPSCGTNNGVPEGAPIFQCYKCSVTSEVMSSSSSTSFSQNDAADFLLAAQLQESTDYDRPHAYPTYEKTTACRVFENVAKVGKTAQRKITQVMNQGRERLTRSTENKEDWFNLETPLKDEQPSTYSLPEKSHSTQYFDIGHDQLEQKCDELRQLLWKKDEDLRAVTEERDKLKAEKSATPSVDLAPFKKKALEAQKLISDLTNTVNSKQASIEDMEVVTDQLMVELSSARSETVAMQARIDELTLQVAALSQKEEPPKEEDSGPLPIGSLEQFCPLHCSAALLVDTGPPPVYVGKRPQVFSPLARGSPKKSEEESASSQESPLILKGVENFREDEVPAGMYTRTFARERG